MERWKLPPIEKHVVILHLFLKQKRAKDNPASYTLRALVPSFAPASLVFPRVCHSNQKTLLQNRAAAPAVKHCTGLAWVSSLGLNPVAVRFGSPV